MKQISTLILGAGAAGMMCAAQAGPDTLVVDHAKAPGEKIRISGGGRCNFTNLHVSPERFLSRNPHFCKSALSRYTQWDFIEQVERCGIAWHEKTLGQLFCDGKSTQIVSMLREQLEASGARLWLETELRDLGHDGTAFRVTLERRGQHHDISARRLVLATGGKSIPKMGASGLSLDIAARFNLEVIPPRAGLVPLSFPDGRFSTLAGVSAPCTATAGGAAFDEALLFTHRGLSGPAILQISNYWREGEEIELRLSPPDLFAKLKEERGRAGRVQITTALASHLPARLVAFLAPELELAGKLADHSDARLADICRALASWRLRPTGTEGYRTAEVMLGGICTSELDSKDMQARAVPGLYAIGEAVDVTGWLGGYNFQWAWSSGWAAGTAIAAESAGADGGGARTWLSP